MRKTKSTRLPRASTVIARDELADHHVVSTVRVEGRARPYETMVIDTRSGETLCCVRRKDACGAMLAHRALVAERTAEREKLKDPNWVFEMMGLPRRRCPSTRPIEVQAAPAQQDRPFDEQSGIAG
jgi:hypothetical protein